MRKFEKVLSAIKPIACVALLIALIISLIKDDYINAILIGVVYLIVRE